MLQKASFSLLVAVLASTGLVLAAAGPGSPKSAPVAASTADASADAAGDARKDAQLHDAPREAAPPDAIRADAPPDQGTDAAVPACIEWHGEARYRPYGYDHVVVIKSACAKPADCTVSTNVNPEVQRILVPAGATVEVYTFLVSPAREFTAYVQCKLRS
jgi:hypothetical protein